MGPPHSRRPHSSTGMKVARGRKRAVLPETSVFPSLLQDIQAITADDCGT